MEAKGDMACGIPLASHVQQWPRNPRRQNKATGHSCTGLHSSFPMEEKLNLAQNQNKTFFLGFATQPTAPTYPQAALAHPPALLHRLQHPQAPSIIPEIKL